ncbi:MAG: RIO1 family regulatory kinase/ATPase [Pseudomonadota bacterium]
MFESLTLADLLKKKCAVLREPSSTRPALWVVEEEGVRAVVKDYSLNGFLFRNFVGRFLAWREEKAYRRLRGLRGVPHFYRVIDGLALVMEEIQGKSLEGLERESRLSEAFFVDLKALIRSVHRRGLAHCDLKRAPNTLLGNDGLPYIVDWSAGISLREFRPYPLNLIFRRFLRDDLDAIVKLQLRHCPETVSSEDRARYDHRGRLERLVRAIRDNLRELLQKIA